MPNLTQGPARADTGGYLDEKRATRESAWESTRNKLCHNCDTNPVWVAKTDFIDDLRLLIPRNLLNRQR